MKIIRIKPNAWIKRDKKGNEWELDMHSTQLSRSMSDHCVMGKFKWVKPSVVKFGEGKRVGAVSYWMD